MQKPEKRILDVQWFSLQQITEKILSNEIVDDLRRIWFRRDINAQPAASARRRIGDDLIGIDHRASVIPAKDSRAPVSCCITEENIILNLDGAPEEF